MIPKLEKIFSSVCRGRWDEPIDVQHRTFQIKTKSRYSFQDRGTTDRQTESISECTLKDLLNDIWHAYQIWKLVCDEENNIPPSLH